jgi:hypothetical protein
MDSTGVRIPDRTGSGGAGSGCRSPGICPDFANAQKLDFVTREKRIFVGRRKLILLVDFRRKRVAFSRRMVDFCAPLRGPTPTFSCNC